MAWPMCESLGNISLQEKQSQTEHSLPTFSNVSNRQHGVVDGGGGQRSHMVPKETKERESTKEISLQGCGMAVPQVKTASLCLSMDIKLLE